MADISISAAQFGSFLSNLANRELWPVSNEQKIGCLRLLLCGGEEEEVITSTQNHSLDFTLLLFFSSWKRSAPWSPPSSPALQVQLLTGRSVAPPPGSI